MPHVCNTTEARAASIASRLHRAVPGATHLLLFTDDTNDAYLTPLVASVRAALNGEPAGVAAGDARPAASNATPAGAAHPAPARPGRSPPLVI